MALPAWVFARRLGWGIAGALMTPFNFPLMFYAVARSAVLTLRQGGIWWRETFYPLDQLHAGGVK
jgi:hypothetical protein